MLILGPVVDLIEGTYMTIVTRARESSLLYIKNIFIWAPLFMREVATRGLRPRFGFANHLVRVTCSTLF
jgi:hypothetical protein